MEIKARVFCVLCVLFVTHNKKIYKFSVQLPTQLVLHTSLFVPCFNSFLNSFTSFIAVTTLLSSSVKILFIMLSVHVGIKLYITGVSTKTYLELLNLKGVSTKTYLELLSKKGRKYKNILRVIEQKGMSTKTYLLNKKAMNTKTYLLNLKDVGTKTYLELLSKKGRRYKTYLELLNKKGMSTKHTQSY